MNKLIHIFVLFFLIFSLKIFPQKSTPKNNECFQFEKIGSLNLDELNYLTLNYEKIKLLRDVNHFYYNTTGNQVFNAQSYQTLLNRLKCAIIQNNTQQIFADSDGVFNDKNIQNDYYSFLNRKNDSPIEVLEILTLKNEKLIFDLKEFQPNIKNTALNNVQKYLMCVAQNELRSSIQQLKNLDKSYKNHYLTQKDFADIVKKKNKTCSANPSAQNEQGQGKGKGMGKGKGKF